MRKIRFDKKSIGFGLIIGFILLLSERFYHAFHNFILNHFPTLGNKMASCGKCVTGVAYTGSGTNVDGTTTVGWVKEGMTADDFLKEKEKQSGTTSTTTVSVTGSSDPKVTALSVFQTYWAEYGEKKLRGYWSQFKADWIDNSGIFSQLVSGFNQAFYTYFGSTRGSSASLRFSEYISYLRNSDGFVQCVANMHLIVNSLEKELITTKNDYKKKGINPDTSILFADRKLWKASKDSNTNWLDSALDVSSNFRKMKDELAEWCKPIALAMNTEFYSKLKVSLF